MFRIVLSAALLVILRSLAVGQCDSTEQLELFANDGFTRLAISNSFGVTLGPASLRPATAAPGPGQPGHRAPASTRPIETNPGPGQPGHRPPAGG